MKNTQNLNKSSNYEDELPKEAFEIVPSEGEDPSEEDKKNQKPLNNLADSYNNNYSNLNFESTIKEGYERRAREQAKVISDLHEYKLLCEKRIKQLSPGHPLPIKETHLNCPPSDEKVNENLEIENHNLKKEIQNLRNIINYKEEENSQLNKKLEHLSIRLNNVYTESVPKTLAIKRESSGGKKTNEFPPADRIPIDKIKENYHRLQQTVNSLLNEKEQILESLRLETVTNEEQRNYIEILKQALENKINNTGMKSYIQQQKHNHYGRDVSNIDVLVDFTQFKSETENAKKELVMANVYINELKQEIEFLKKVNEDLAIKQEKVKESFENNKREVFNLSEKMRELEIDKNSVEETRTILKDENERLIKDYDQIILKNRKFEKENSDLGKKINELNLKLMDFNALQSKLNEFKRNYDKLNEDYSLLANEKTKMEEDLNKTCEDFTAKSEEAKITKMSLKEQIEKIDNEKKSFLTENLNLNSKIKKLEKQINEFQSSIKDSQSDCKIQEDRNHSLENQLNILKNDYDNLSKDKEELKIHNQKELEKLENTIKENHFNYKELKHQLENVTLDKKLLVEENSKLKREISSLEKENSIQRNNLEMTEKNLGSMNDQYEEIIYNYRQLEIENNNILGQKENLDLDIKRIKDNAEIDIKSLNQQIMNLENELKNSKEKINNLLQKTDSQNVEINNLKNIIKENNLRIDDFLNKEVDYKKKEEHLEILNNKFETLYFEHNTLIKEFNNLTERTEEVIREKNQITEILRNKEKTLNNSNDENTKLRHNLNQLTQSSDDLFSKYEKLANENNQTSLKYNELLNKFNFQLKQIDDLGSKINQFNFDKENNEILSQKILLENENLRKVESELNSKLTYLQNILYEAKLSAKSSLTLLKSIFGNFITGRFSKSFDDLLSNFNVNMDSELNLKDYFRCADELSRILSNELDLFYHEKNELNEKNKINLNRSQVLEQKIVSLDNEKSIVENNLRYQVKQFAEDNKTLILDLENLNRKYEKLFQESKKIKSDLYQIVEEKREFLEENKRLNETINSILKEKEDSDNSVTEAKNTIKALEERMVITIHQRSIFESLLSRISNAYPHREMSRSINECMDVLDQNFDIEREKLKLEQRINLLGNELLHNEMSSNIDLKTKIKEEIENLKNLYCQYNDKLEENFKKQKLLEESMKMFEIQEKRKNEKIIEYEQLITKLRKDYNEAVDELRKLKPVNLFKNNFSHDSRNAYQMTASSVGKSLPKFNTNKEIINDNIKTEVLLKTESNYYSNKPESTKLNTNTTHINYKPKMNPRYETLNTTNNEEKINKTNCTLPAYENMSVDNSYIASDKKPLNETELNDFNTIKLSSIRNNYSGILRNNTNFKMDFLGNNNITHKDL